MVVGLLARTSRSQEWWRLLRDSEKQAATRFRIMGLGSRGLGFRVWDYVL